MSSSFPYKTLKLCDYVVGGGQQNQCKHRQGTQQETETQTTEKNQSVSVRVAESFWLRTVERLIQSLAE